MGTVVQSGDEVDALLRHSGESVGLLLDTGHLRFAGDDPVQAAVRHATRIVHVHCKDLRPAVLSNVLNRDSSFLDAVVDGVFTVPGDGCIDYAAVFEPLARAGYAGWLVVEAEQDPVVANPLEYARKGHDYLQRVALDLFR
jgi:inosose dehydratase